MARNGIRAALRRTSALALVAATVTCASCAYYNTFFFAEKYYKQAERARKGRADDKPTSQELGFYEKCIKQCSKVIAEYPDSKYVDDALFLMATCYYYSGKYDDSMKWYKQLEESYPQSELVREARFMTARCHLGRYEYVDAENILTQLLGSAQGEERDKIIFALAEVGVSRGGTEDAVRYLRELVEGGASEDLLLEAYLALGDAYFTSGAYDSAAMSYEQVARRSGKKEQRIEARMRMGRAWQARGEYQRALDIYSELLLSVEGRGRKRKSKDTQEASLLLRMGECHNSLGEHESALELFNRVMQDFPKSAVAAEAEYLTGYTYEIYYEDLVRAKISYDRVPSHFGRSVFIDEAKRRSEGLGKLQQYLEEDVQEAEDVEGKAAFLSAELNLFQLNKPEKAIEIYRSIEKNYPDSPLAPKAAYAVAWVLAKRLGREEEGMEEFRRIVEEYPYTEYAEGARRVLGMIPLAAQLEGPQLPKGWTPPDSAVAVPDTLVTQPGGGLPHSVSQTGSADAGAVAADSTGSGAVVGADSTRAGAVARTDSTRGATPADSTGGAAAADSTGSGGVVGTDSTRAGAVARGDSTRGTAPAAADSVGGEE